MLSLTLTAAADLYTIRPIMQRMTPFNFETEHKKIHQNQLLLFIHLSIWYTEIRRFLVSKNCILPTGISNGAPENGWSNNCKILSSLHDKLNRKDNIHVNIQVASIITLVINITILILLYFDTDTICIFLWVSLSISNTYNNNQDGGTCKRPNHAICSVQPATIGENRR